MRFHTLLALAAATALSVPPALAQEEGTEADNPIAETFGIETGPADFDDIEIDGLSVEALSGSDILARNGDVIGLVADILVTEDDADKIVMVLDDGVMAGTSNLLIPLDEVQIQEDGDTLRVRTTLTEETVAQLAEYDSI